MMIPSSLLSHSDDCTRVYSRQG